MSTRLFLYEPSKDNAYLNGLGYWWELLEKLPEASLVGNVSEVEGSGVFVSFDPIDSKEDVYPQLQGSVQRWLYVDHEVGFSDTCLLAKDAGVERVFHKRLVDEIGTHVPPTVIGYLQDRGTWLPALDTLKEILAKMDRGREEGASGSASGCLSIVGGDGSVDTDRTQKGGFSDPLVWDLLSGALKSNDVAVNQTTVDEFLSGKVVGSYQLYVVRDCEVEFVIALVEFARGRGAKVAFASGSVVSPLSLRFLGARAPVYFSFSSSSLRQAGRDMSALLRPLGSEFQDRSGVEPFLNSLSDSELTKRLLEGSVVDDVCLPEYLSSREGASYIDWLAKRVKTSPEDMNLALFLASEFFREAHRYALLIGDAVIEGSACFDRLENLLVTARELAGARGAYYSWHLAWIALLNGDFDRVVSYFQGSRLSGKEGILLVCQFGVELYIALLYRGQATLANDLMKVVVSYVGENFEDRDGFVGVAFAFAGNLKYELDREGKLKCQESWLLSFSLGYLYSKDGYEEQSLEYIRIASEIYPERTSLFCKALGVD